MAIRFIVDSASDILPEEAEKLGMIHVPLTVCFGEREYRDGVDLNHREFYEKLIESDTLPVTSQVTPGTFSRVLATLPPEDDAIIVTLSSRLSGTYQSACIAAEEYPGRVFVVDSLSATLGQRILILRGLELAKQGMDAESVARQMDREREHVRIMAVLDTLEYLKKGGRISTAAAFAGTLLSIKPVIAVEDGAVALVGKARGSKNGSNLLRQMVQQCGGIRFDRPYALAYSGLSDAMLQKYIEDSGELWKGQADNLPIYTVGSAIGTHIGPGAVAVAFFDQGA